MVPSVPGVKRTGPGRISSSPGRSTAPDSGSTPGKYPGPGNAGLDPAPGAGSNGSAPGAGSRRFHSTESGKTRVEVLEQVRISRKYKFEFAVNREFKEKFDRMKALLSSRYPQGISFEALFMLLMDEYIERHSPEARAARREKREAAKSSRRPGLDSVSIERTRSIPAKVRDEIFLRDGGRCTFKGTDGRRCNSKWNLQIDHIVPFALGGDNSPGNLRLLCGKHNRLEAERIYGSHNMKRFRKQE
jgi:5-methylcytosine-specific restriction endonuclease McrA